MNKNSLELWKQRIADRKASGLKVVDWCEKNNLTKHAYYYWKKRVEANEHQPDESQPVFVEIGPSCMATVNTEISGLQITWNDINLTISDSENAKLAAEFINHLQRLC